MYKSRVPNQRAPGQKLLPIAVDEKFLRELDAGLLRAGYQNRSQFIRDAIVEKLTRAGVHLPKELSLPPNRFSKSSAKISYPSHRPSSYTLNDKTRPAKKTGHKST